MAELARLERADRGVRIEQAIHAAMGRTRDARNLSALARKAGVQRDTLYAWFTGQRPEPETQQKVADALGVRVIDLWPADEEEPAPALEPQMASLIVALGHQTAAMSALVDRLGEMMSPEWIAKCVAASIREVSAVLSTEPNGTDSPSAAPASSRPGRP